MHKSNLSSEEAGRSYRTPRTFDHDTQWLDDEKLLALAANNQLSQGHKLQILSWFAGARFGRSPALSTFAWHGTDFPANKFTIEKLYHLKADDHDLPSGLRRVQVVDPVSILRHHATGFIEQPRTNQEAYLRIPIAPPPIHHR